MSVTKNVWLRVVEKVFHWQNKHLINNTFCDNTENGFKSFISELQNIIKK